MTEREQAWATGGAVRAEVAGVADWERVRDIRLAALADAPDAFASTLAEESRQPAAYWQERLRRPDARTLLAVDGTGRDVGITVVAASFDDLAVGAVYAVWVAPPARGSGAADALVAAALRTARELGYPRVVLDVGEHNAAAQRLYARHGFTATGRTYRFDPPREHVVEHELARDLQEP